MTLNIIGNDLIKRTSEYRLIKIFYGNLKAERSGVLLINHIDEGLRILKDLGTDGMTRRAWCIHPMIQSDEALVQNSDMVTHLPGDSVLLAMEYRHYANDYLSQRVIQGVDEIRLSPLTQVNLMLMADKIQNRKDFNLYHKGKHPRSAELEQYFKNWFVKLGIPE